ncbi:MAG: hypothetical protein SOZ34_00785 [Clostridia bacterium]|nr:hypothetical protein [Clostridia bacterium]
MATIKTAWDFLQNQVLSMKWLDGDIGKSLSGLGFNLQFTE